MPEPKTPPVPAFGPVHVVEPTAAHTHTAILAHGRGSDGEEFAEELLDETRLSSGQSLAARFPGWRWVFPSAPKLWSTAFQESMPAWFEAHSLTDPAARQDLQRPGLRASVAHLRGVVADEIARLGGGYRQAGSGRHQPGRGRDAVDAAEPGPGGRLGAFVGASTWLPLAGEVQAFLGGLVEVANENKAMSETRENKALSETSDDKASSKTNENKAFVKDMLGASLAHPTPAAPFLSTPVFFGHGCDDAYVDITLGTQARHVLECVGFVVAWHTYTGAEQEGHWLKAPEEVDDMAAFLAEHVEGRA